MTLVNKETLIPWRGEILNDLRYPANIEALWTDEELDAIGLARPKKFAAPEGKNAVGPATYEKDANGVVIEVRATVDEPPPQPDPLDDIRRRLDALEAALSK